MAHKKGLKNMKFNFLEKHSSRRRMLRDSATLAGSALLAHLVPATLICQPADIAKAVLYLTTTTYSTGPRFAGTEAGA
jgi:hypothetical protein